MPSAAPPSDAREVLRAVVQAPIVEEVGKGLGLLLLFATARRAFDGPVDGVVYGALIGAGFAFTENIQYFAIAFIEGGAVDLTTTFFVRGILSPFAHAMFTSVTGLALGLAARRGARFGAALGPWLLGLTGAVLLHAFWNGSAVFGDFFQLYMTLQIPLFVIFILGVLGLKREEARLTRNRLGDYAVAGWFTPQEVEMLASSGGRRAGLAWARTLSGDRTAIMKEFINDATALAAARQRGISGRDPRAAEDEQVLLARTAAARFGAPRALSGKDSALGAAAMPACLPSAELVWCRRTRVPGTRRRVKDRCPVAPEAAPVFAAGGVNCARRAAPVGWTHD